MKENHLPPPSLSEKPLLTEAEKSQRLSELEARFFKAVEAGQIGAFPKSVFDALRPYHYGGLPLSILLFIPELCNGLCYDRSSIMTLAFAKCQQHYGDIESLRVKADPEHAAADPLHADHAFVEAYDHIFDTSNGLVYTKEAYWEVERPEVRLSHTKQECLRSYEMQQILSNDFAKDRWALILTLPIVEDIVNNPKHASTKINQEMLLAEIALLKQAIDYDGMVTEQDEDMKLMRTDPVALDRKFGIVRDEYGHTISRDGIPDPYYKKIDPATLPQLNAQFENDMQDPKRQAEFHAAVMKRVKNEDRIAKAKAKAFLKKVKRNPTSDVYDALKGKGT